MSLAEWGSIASIIGVILALFVAKKIINKTTKIGKIEIDDSDSKQENKSILSFFNIQINKKD